MCICVQPYSVYIPRPSGLFQQLYRQLPYAITSHMRCLIRECSQFPPNLPHLAYLAASSKLPNHLQSFATVPKSCKASFTGPPWFNALLRPLNSTKNT